MQSASITLLLFVSASDFEMSSLSVHEAHICGLPCVCLWDEALTGLVEHNVNGFTYHHPKEFIDFILLLLNDDLLYSKMSATALERSKNYSMHYCAEKFIKLYQRVLSRRKHSHTDK